MQTDHICGHTEKKTSERTGQKGPKKYFLKMINRHRRAVYTGGVACCSCCCGALNFFYCIIARVRHPQYHRNTLQYHRVQYHAIQTSSVRTHTILMQNTICRIIIQQCNTTMWCQAISNIMLHAIQNHTTKAYNTNTSMFYLQSSKSRQVRAEK